MEWKSISDAFWQVIFFEDDDNIVCLLLAETDGTFPSALPKTRRLGLTHSEFAREKAHGKILPVTSASCWGKAPARLFPLTLFTYHFKEVRPCLSITCLCL